MKTLLNTLTKKIALLLLFGLMAYGCDIHHNDFGPDSSAPDAPGGVYVLNGDNIVDVYWDPVTNRDLAGYNVYYSTSYNGKYTLLGSTKQTKFTDDGAKNGVTYYYAVASYDYDGNESDLSYEDAHATPRPEGFDQILYDYRRFPNNAGYNFANSRLVNYQSQDADFFFENYNGTFYLNVWDDSDIQDMGKTQDIYDIPTAPARGWSPTKDTLAVIGHTYVIWTWDNHYAKIRITNITSERITFDWAYQEVKGNKDLKTGRDLENRTYQKTAESLERIQKRRP